MTRASALIIIFALFINVNAVFAAKSPPVNEIVYIPHDDRPISLKQTAEVAARAGYKIITPPKNLLGNHKSLGFPDELWKWYEGVMKSFAKDKKIRCVASVLSSDSLLYGSLVASRKHTYSENELYSRVRKFTDIRKKYPQANLYVFGSIMRTPKSAADSGHMEPKYYDNYGEDIFRFTALKDKQETEGLNRRNQAELEFLRMLLPNSCLNDWSARRFKNFNVNRALIDLAKNDTFDYLLLGRDDNARYSATHQEKRKLLKYAASLSKDKFASAAGIDEAGMLLLTRAILKDKNSQANVFVRYNWGSGEFVIPAYSDEPIDISINDEIEIAGAERTEDINNADLALTVNTNPNGKTGNGALYSNNTKEREGTRYFADTIEEYLAINKPVAVADIAFANGSDNALMETLKKRDLLFKITSYAGWNTATNSSGFALGVGLLAKNMKKTDKDALLTTRYLDDWMYQGNIRTIVARQLTWLKGDGVYGSLNDKREWAENRVHHILDSFLREDLPTISASKIKINLPWNRMFEADIIQYQ